MRHDRSQDIRDRTFRFACDVAKLALTLSREPGVRCIGDQLLKSGTSVGANLEEAKAGSSRRDFVNCAQISLKEAREAVYWLKICQALQLGPEREVEVLRGEGEQIARILGAIIVNAKTRMSSGVAVFAFCILHFAF